MKKPRRGPKYAPPDFHVPPRDSFLDDIGKPYDKDDVTSCFLCNTDFKGLFSKAKEKITCPICGGVYCSSCCRYPVVLDNMWGGKQKTICQFCNSRVEAYKKEEKKKLQMDISGPTAVSASPVKVVAKTDLPAPKVINDAFEKFMNDTNIADNEVKREKFLQMSLEQKWALVMTYQATSAATHAHTENTPIIFVNKIRDNGDLETITATKVCLYTEPLNWMVQFIKHGGVNALVELFTTILANSERTPAEQSILEIIIECLHAIVNVRGGCEAIINEIDSLRAIVQSVTQVEGKIQVKLFEIMTGLCALSPVALDIIVGCLEAFTDQVTDILLYSKVPDNNREACLIFINSIISGMNGVEAMKFRERYKLDLVLSVIANRKISRELHTQVDNYRTVTCSTGDMPIYSVDIVENSIIQECKKLTEHMKQFTDILPIFKEYFSRLKSLYMVGERGKIGWSFVDIVIQTVAEICPVDDSVTLCKSTCMQLLEHFNLVPSDLMNYTARDEPDDEFNIPLPLSLRSSGTINNSPTRPGNEKPSSPLVPSPIKTSTSQLSTASTSDTTITSKEELATPSGVVQTVIPPPPSGGDTSMPPPPPMMGGPPGPPPPMMGGPPGPPPPMMGGPPGPPPMMGAGPPPPFGTAGAAVPQKPDIKPTIKMRNFNWQKLNWRMVKNTFWDGVDETDIDVHPTELEQLYGQPEKKKFVIQPIAKPKAISLLDLKRSQNMSISLSQFSKIPLETLRDAILNFNETILSPDGITSLYNNCPTSDEFKVVKEFKGDLSLLDKPEKFVLMASGIPRYQQRLGSLQTKQQFGPKHQQCINRLELMQKALDVISNNANLKEFLRITLAVGNYMNGGTIRGGAFGFKMPSLTKMVDCRSILKSKVTLLHYVIQIIKSDHAAELLNIPEEFAVLQDAARFDIKMVLSELGEEVYPSINAIRDELAIAKEAEDTIYCEYFQRFYDEAQEDIQKSKEMMSRLQSSFTELAKYFAEEPAITYQEMVANFSLFATQFKQALIDVEVFEKQDRLKEKQQQKAIEKAQDSERGILDSVLGSLRAGTTTTE